MTPSLAIDTADQINCPATDEHSAARPLNGCDIGAYEFGAKVPQTIGFTLPSLIGMNQSPYPLGDSASSGLVVSYTVGGTPCSLAGSNQLISSGFSRLLQAVTSSFSMASPLVIHEIPKARMANVSSQNTGSYPLTADATSLGRMKYNAASKRQMAMAYPHPR